MKAIDIHGMTNMELVRGETDEWYLATDYIHGDLYEAVRVGNGNRFEMKSLCAVFIFCFR